MCGFAGVVTWDERFRVTRDTLARMSARVAHRGPDGEGLFLNHEAKITPARPQVALAHRRLAILDPDPRANQPFADAAGRQLVFNGEIYNFRELRAELSSLRPDYRWRTDCDTEVLLVAYDAWGEHCVDHFNGMFAFAIWDAPNDALFLARDRMGQKPLYVAFQIASESGWSAYALWHPAGVEEPLTAVAFASELPALRPLVPGARFTEFGVGTLNHYLRWGYVPAGASIFEEFGSLPAAACYTVRFNERLRVRHYFSPATGTPLAPSDGPAEWPEATGRGSRDAVARTRELVTAAVRRQLVSDVPLGCFLSGGVDSSVIAAAMKASAPAGQPVMTFSIGFDDPRYDESAYAARVAAHLGTQHHAFKVAPHAAEDLPKLAAAFGEPFGDSSALPTHYLARETRQFVKVALSGDGGDELFGGYDRYRAMALGRRLRTLFTPLPFLFLSPLLYLLPAGHPKSRWARARRLLASLDQSSVGRYASYLNIFDDELLHQLQGYYLRKYDSWVCPDPLWRTYEEQRRTLGPVRAALAADRATYLPDDLLTKVDRASMLHALEVRGPFMDHELVAFAAGLSESQLLRGGGKRMLREAFAADLPAEVFTRPKMGFAVPIGDWLRGPLRPMLRDCLFAADSFAAGHFNKPVLERMVEQHERGRVDHSQRLYALLMLELWWQSVRRGS